MTKKIERPTCKTCFWWETDKDLCGFGVCHNLKVKGHNGESCGWCEEHPDMWAYKMAVDFQKPQCNTCKFVSDSPKQANGVFFGKCIKTGMRLYDDGHNGCYLHEKKRKK